MSWFFLSERGFARLRIACGSAAILSVCLCAANVAQAQDASQDVAEAARQARARKAAQAANPSPASSHVYTNDDLQRAQILVKNEASGEPASVEARKRDSPPPVNAPAASASQVSTNGTTQDSASTESLGEVARRYRREKAEREVERASKNPLASPFHMEVAQPALAEISPRRAPTSPVRVAPTSIAPLRIASAPSEKNVKSGADGVAPIATLKRDPFSRPATLTVPRRTNVPTIAIVKPAEPISPAARVVESGAFAKRSASVVPSDTVKSLAVAPTRSLSPAANAPAVPRTPETARRSDGVVAIRAGDSLWKLSRRYLGGGAYWREWLASNPDVSDPLRLRPGSSLVVPGKHGERSCDKLVSVSRNARTVVVRQGDSLWKISAGRYGHGAYWACVAQANAQLHGKEMIHPGLVLLLPAACGAGSTSRLSVTP
jgi:nucleoid-associated protein YgaU